MSGANSRGGPDRRSPALEPALEGIQQRDDGEPGRGKQENSEKNDVGLEAIPSERNHMPYAMYGGIELAHDHAEQSTAGSVLQPGEDERHGSREDNAREQLERTRAEAAGHPQEPGFVGLHA